MAAPRSLAGADVLPWRPATGAYLLFEESASVPIELVDVAGVAGLWSWTGSSTLHARLAPVEGRRLTVCWLDADPATTGELVGERLAARPAGGGKTLLAAPFEAVVAFQWAAALPG